MAPSFDPMIERIVGWLAGGPVSGKRMAELARRAGRDRRGAERQAGFDAATTPHIGTSIDAWKGALLEAQRRGLVKRTSVRDGAGPDRKAMYQLVPANG